MSEPIATPPEPTNKRSKSWPHKRGQKILFGVNLVVAFACIVSGVALFWASQRLSARQVVTIEHVDKFNGNAGEDPFDSLAGGDLSARNFLITGADNNSCVPKTSKYYKTLAGRDGLSERSDTIMVIRVNPSTEQSAILSFPRDMWVKIAGSNHHSKINSAFDRKNPNRLIQTIELNFGIRIDHYVNIDFCAFMSLVNAVDGIRIPFEYAARDRHTNFYIAKPGCIALTGEDALAYVRSRHYYYKDPKTGDWKEDPAADRGRIARQQDFVRRILQKAIDKGGRNPRVANDLLNVALKDVITDDELTPIKLLQLAKAMRNIDSRTIRTYTVEGLGRVLNDSSIIEPNLESDTMVQILDIFKGKAGLSTTVEQNLENSTTATPTPTTGATTTVTGTTSSVTPTIPTTTLSVVEPEQVPVGLVPPRNSECH